MTMKVDAKACKSVSKRKCCAHLPKPWSNKKFIIDIEDPRHRDLLVKEIEKLGGLISEEFNNDESLPVCVVSDYHRVDIFKNSRLTSLSEKQKHALPLILRSAIDLNIRIQSYDMFMKNLSSLKKRLKTNYQSTKAPSKSKTDVRLLNSPSFKLEQVDGRYAPDIKEFSSPTNFPTLYLGNNTGKSVFHHVTKEDRLKERRQPKSVEVSQEFIIHKANLQRRGLCDVCTKHCDDLRMHCTSREHLKNVSQPGFYDDVDELCFSTEFVDTNNYPNVYRTRRSSEVSDSSFIPNLSIEI